MDRNMIYVFYPPLKLENLYCFKIFVQVNGKFTSDQSLIYNVSAFTFREVSIPNLPKN